MMQFACCSSHTVCKRQHCWHGSCRCCRRPLVAQPWCEGKCASGPSHHMHRWVCKCGAGPKAQQRLQQCAGARGDQTAEGSNGGNSCKALLALDAAATMWWVYMLCQQPHLLPVQGSTGKAEASSSGGNSWNGRELDWQRG